MTIDISRFSNCRALVVGDLMMDEYVWGSVDRISPEAPVQVVSVERDGFTLGGAGNVVNNLAALGASVSVAGIIGAGADGARLLDLCRNLCVDTGGVCIDPNRPTTRKTRIIAGNQHVLRIDRETKREIAGPAMERMIDFLRERIAEADVVLISDYAKGVVTPAVIREIIQSAKKKGTPVLADPKGRDFSKYAGVYLLTPNRKEALLASGVELAAGETLDRAARRIFDAAAIQNLLITCGPDGMVLYEGDRPARTIPAEARQVFDVSGAGDTVLSVLGLGIAAGFSLHEAAKVANTAAGVVVGKVGTATVTREELASALRKSPDGTPERYKSLKEMAAAARELRNRNQRIVLTNGCFDLLHAGHIMLFAAAKRLGDVLVVAIDDDESVRRLKGNGRPVIRAEERVRILSALDAVDYVITFATGELEEVIRAVRPDVLAKGANYATETVVGHRLVEELGGRVALIPISATASSTEIINTIRNSGATDSE